MIGQKQNNYKSLKIIFPTYIFHAMKQLKRTLEFNVQITIQAIANISNYRCCKKSDEKTENKKKIGIRTNKIGSHQIIKLELIKNIYIYKKGRKQ